MNPEMAQRLAIVLLVVALGSCSSTDSGPTAVNGPRGTIRVAVTSPSADSQIAVLLTGPEGFPPRGTVIGVGGTSTFTDLEPGVYSVSATIFGFDCLSVSVDVRAGETTTADIACTRRTIAQAAMVIAVVTGGESPLSAAFVELTGRGVTRIRRTSTSGSVSFVGLESGAYTLATHHDHFTCPVQTIVVEVPQTTRASISCTPHSTGWIAGTVIHYEDPGWPVVGATVRIDGPTTLTGETPNGSFRFRDLPPGTYTVSASFPNMNCEAAATAVEAARTTTVQISCVFRFPSGTEIEGAWTFGRFLVSQAGSCPEPLPESGAGTLALRSTTQALEFVGLDPAMTILGTYDEATGSYVGTGTAASSDGSSIQSEVFLEFYLDVWDLYGTPAFYIDDTFRSGWTRRHRDPGGTVICTEVYSAGGYRGS